MSNCYVRIDSDGGPELLINRVSNCSWTHKTVHQKLKGYVIKEYYILSDVVQKMCQYAYEQGLEDATKEGSKLERIKRIIEE